MPLWFDLEKVGVPVRAAISAGKAAAPFNFSGRRLTSPKIFLIRSLELMINYLTSSTLLDLGVFSSKSGRSKVIKYTS